MNNLMRPYATYSVQAADLTATGTNAIIQHFFDKTKSSQGMKLFWIFIGKSVRVTREIQLEK